MYQKHGEGRQCLKGDAVTNRSAHGNAVLYSLAKLEIKVDGLTLSVEAAVYKTLSLLGTDVPEINQFLGISSPIPSEQSLTVASRAQALRQAEEYCTIRESEQQCGVQ